jgi:hypothetical protein
MRRRLGAAKGALADPSAPNAYGRPHRVKTVLDRAVGSMTEFKQIVGRGTRVHEDTKKFYFTLIDFRGATRGIG